MFVYYKLEKQNKCYKIVFKREIEQGHGFQRDAEGNRRKCWEKRRRARGEVAFYRPVVFVHNFTAGVPAHTDNCCLQLGANIWLFIYSSERGSSSTLYLCKARAQGSSDSWWIKAQQGRESTLLFHFRRSEVEASSPYFCLLMVSRKCQIHVNPQQENPI